MKVSLDQRYRHALISILLFAFFYFIVWLIPWESSFAGFGLFLMTEIIGTLAAGFLIVLRALKVQVNNIFIYNALGVLQMAMALILIYFGLRNAELILKGLLVANVALGVFILWDIFGKESHS